MVFRFDKLVWRHVVKNSIGAGVVAIFYQVNNNNNNNNKKHDSHRVIEVIAFLQTTNSTAMHT